MLGFVFFLFGGIFGENKTLKNMFFLFFYLELNFYKLLNKNKQINLFFSTLVEL